MLGTMPNYSHAKHIDLTHACGNYENGSLLASCFSNSFGDKIIYFREYRMIENYGATCSGFETIGVSVYHEGNHPNFEEMLREAKKYLDRK